jgi:hypothetical protein
MVIEIRGDKVRLGIDAPKDVGVMRNELIIREKNMVAVGIDPNNREARNLLWRYVFEKTGDRVTADDISYGRMELVEAQLS